MRLFYCNNTLSNIVHASTSESIFRANGHNLASKNCHAILGLLSVDFFNSLFATIYPKHLAPHRYSVFGFSSPSDNEWGFKGERKDSTSNGYLLGNGRRLYSPYTMRFNRPDPMSPFSMGGLNCYAFVLNDPVNGSDPTGLLPQFITKPLLWLMKKKTYRGDILWQHDGIIAFSGPQRKDDKPGTLYILSHGSPGRLSGDELTYRSARIFDRLEQAGIDMNGRQTHIFACHSASRTDIGGASVADEMANLTKAQSSGYDGFVPVDFHIADNRKIVVDLLYLPVLGATIGATASKIRSGNIRNPHKKQNTGLAGYLW